MHSPARITHLEKDNPLIANETADAASIVERDETRCFMTLKPTIAEIRFLKSNYHDTVEKCFGSPSLTTQLTY